MTSAEKIKFVNENQSSDFFEKDAALYRKLFPSSRLLPELSRANKYNMTHLDGRMLLEILDVVCGETVMENRGIVKDNNPDAQILMNTFIKADLDKVSYQDRKKWVKELGLNVADQKNDTLVTALKAKQQELQVLQAGENKTEGSDVTGSTPEPPAGDDSTEKKSEGLE